MKTATFLAAGCALVFAAGSAFAATAEYQVTGSVTALTDTVITVLKGKESFEIARSADTKVTGSEVKVGDKVTVHYTIAATAIEDKGAAPAGKKPKAAAPTAAAAPSPAAKP